MTIIHVKRFVLSPLSTCRMIQHEKKARRHHRTCVTNVMFALQEPHAVLCWGGCMHDCAYTLSTTSTPCAYLHTQSCLVSLCLKTSLLFKIQSQSCSFTATCVSHQCWLLFFLSASLRQRGRDLGSLVYDVIFWKAKVRYACWSPVQKLCLSICRLLCVWPDIIYNLMSVWAVQVAG